MSTATAPSLSGSSPVTRCSSVTSDGPICSDLRASADQLAHSMLGFAEMLGRLAVNDPDTYPRQRLEDYANAAMAVLRAKA